MPDGLLLVEDEEAIRNELRNNVNWADVASTRF